MAVYPVTFAIKAPAATCSRSDRLYYLDNLRVVLTIAVIAHHVGQAYGPTGGFWPIQDAARSDLLGPFFTINRSFGMSLFFLIAGYFMVRSYDAHGPRSFVRSRLTRLGLPLVTFMLIATPVIWIWAAPPESQGAGLPEPNALHLWFVQHLLIYSLCYAGLRVLLSRRPPATTAPTRLAPPGTLAIVLFALGLGLVSATVRTWSPIDDWRNLFGFLRVAFADVPRDLSFFVIGAMAYRHQWLANYSPQAGRAWLVIGLVLGAWWYLFILSGLAARPLSAAAQGLGYAIWESLLCCGMCIGLLVVFRDKLNAQTPLTAELGRSQYLAYVIHILPVLALEGMLLTVAAPALVKFLFVSAAATVLTFSLSSWLRRPLRL
jgi:glucans biosynthesis protein C